MAIQAGDKTLVGDTSCIIATSNAPSIHLAHKIGFQTVAEGQYDAVCRIWCCYADGLSRLGAPAHLQLVIDHGRDLGESALGQLAVT